MKRGNIKRGTYIERKYLIKKTYRKKKPTKSGNVYKEETC